MRRFLFRASGALPALGLFGAAPGFMALLYSFYVLARAFPSRWESFARGRSRFAAFLLSALLVGVLTESLAWLQNYAEGFKNPKALFSQNYLQDILIGSGYYVGLAAAFNQVAKRYGFTVGEAFATYGFFGIFMEQNAAVFLSAAATAVANPLLALFMILYVFAVHGSILGLAYMPVARRFGSTDRRRRRFPIALIAIYIGVFAGTLVTGFLFQTR